MPVRIFIISDTIRDSKKAKELIDEVPAKGLIADKGYDSKDIIEFAIDQNMSICYSSQKE